MNHQIIKKYAARLKREGILRSLMYGLIAGCAALTVIALLSWLFDFKWGLFVALGAFTLLTAGSALLLYRFRFRPSEREIARRVDALGLEERMITMAQLEGDESYIAAMQREDTLRALEKADHMMLKIVLSASLVIAVAAVGLAGVGATTVDALYYAGVIPSGIGLAQEGVVPQQFTLTYTVSDGEGVIYFVTDGVFSEAKESETVEEGGQGSMIYAYASPDWVFVDWSDGYALPYRQFTDVHEDVSVSARFEPIDDEGADEPEEPPQGGGSGEDGGEGDPSDTGEPSEGNQGESDQQPSGDPGDGQGDGAGGGRDDANNQIIDGQTFYPDEFEGAREDAMDRVGSDGGLSDGEKDLITDYLGSIEKGSSGGTGEGSGGESGNQP